MEIQYLYSSQMQYVLIPVYHFGLYQAFVGFAQFCCGMGAKIRGGDIPKIPYLGVQFFGKGPIR
jgi:hypothetical protein